MDSVGELWTDAVSGQVLMSQWTPRSTFLLTDFRPGFQTVVCRYRDGIDDGPDAVRASGVIRATRWRAGPRSQRPRGLQRPVT